MKIKSVQAVRLPGLALPQDGYLMPVAAPGFGMELKAEWLSPFFT